MAEKRRFEFIEGTSNKSWEIWMEGAKITTRYGRIGSSKMSVSRCSLRRRDLAPDRK